MTPLERAIVVLESNSEDPKLFAKVLERLLDSEIFLALNNDANKTDLDPKTVHLGQKEYVAVYDTELRLEESVGGGAEYIALSGRSLMPMLIGQNTGIALNPGSKSIGYVFETDTLEWLVRSLKEEPEELVAKIEEVRPPAKMSPQALDALSIKLASAQGLADYACLVEATDVFNRKNPLLFFVGSISNSQPILAKLVNEYLQFSDYCGDPWDVTYLDPGHKMVKKILSVGLRFDLPKPIKSVKVVAPGSVKGQPPILR